MLTWWLSSWRWCSLPPSPSRLLPQKYFPSNLCQVHVVGTFEVARVYIRYTMQIQIREESKVQIKPLLKYLLTHRSLKSLWHNKSGWKPLNVVSTFTLILIFYEQQFCPCEGTAKKNPKGGGDFTLDSLSTLQLKNFGVCLAPE